MSHAGASDHGTPAFSALGQPIFSPAEIETFRTDDREAATAIVGLMAGIFSVGLIGYLAVATWVGNVPFPIR